MPAILLFLIAASAAYAHDLVLLVDRPGSLLTARAPSPKPPFRFIREDREGSTPKVFVRDARGALWNVKFGEEVKAEVFATKFVAALGYYSDVTHYVGRGRIMGVRNLKRAAKHIDARGQFQDARFEYRNPSLRFLTDGDWTWEKNPFTGTREFNGLKILMMLLSNWDNKDASDGTSNAGILERRVGRDGERIYYVTDWGASMGRWGHLFFREKWDCEQFADQSDDFIKKIDDNSEVKFGFSSWNNDASFKKGIALADVKWLLRRLRNISDSQLRAALRQSGATSHEAQHFTEALRVRIQQLERLASNESSRVQRRATR